MKSSKDSGPHLGIPKADFMKTSSFNFIENERMCIGKTDENCTPKNVLHKQDNLFEKSKTTTLFNRTEAMSEEIVVASEARSEEGRYAPKKYVTKCYFQPKQNPVSYSETVILTLGSNKKHYFDTILYQTKLIPFRWTESMTTSTPLQTAYEFKSNYEYSLEGPKYDFISMEAQQLAAQEKSARAQEIKV
ncbi:hypothetical protein RI129_006005 [Pyrocoelia pectoralis]|uniref:Uncharacterized protein n=1 Tax=Pyrocoelia pectoralis TaxID=417401 RepID=A0AAN7ZFU7_9COLE